MTTPFDIVEVTDRKTLNDFIRAPAAAQGHDPNWVAPLELMKKEDLAINEVFRWGKTRDWIQRGKGDVQLTDAGRAAAVDRPRR